MGRADSDWILGKGWYTFPAMKRYLWLAVALLLCGTFLAGAITQTSPAKPGSSPNAVGKEKKPPGVEVAQTLSMVTGVAISPLLGVGAVGCYRYWHAPEEKRAALPWFAQPWFWGTALLLVLLVGLKDVLGTTLPTALKKPFDVAEVFESKISALVATGAFVPIAASICQAFTGDECGLGLPGLAMIDASPLYNLLIVPVAMVVFLVVWLAGHAINVLVLISLFGTVDAALKSFRAFLFSSVFLTSWMNPYFGAMWAVVIILVSYLLAGWSLRLSVFGSVFAWDLLSFRRARFHPDAKENWMFTARRIEKTPIRSYGRVARDEQGRLVLTYRPWLVLPARQLVLPAGRYFVGRGLFYPEIRRVEGEEATGLLTLPPRYRTHEEEVTQIYSLTPVEDIGLRKGFKAIWAWLKGLFGRKPKPATVAA